MVLPELLIEDTLCSDIEFVWRISILSATRSAIS
jgi:hypothetical protein